MLAFFFCDAHFHLVPLMEFSVPNFFNLDRVNKEKIIKEQIFPNNFKYQAISCAHSQEEFEKQEQILGILKKCAVSEPNRCIKIYPAFGMHPQMPLVENADFLEKLLQEKKIVAVGETGFDFFPEFRDDEKRQEEAWRISVELAIRYNAAVVIHARKSMHKIFADAKLLRRARAVIFHSFMGSAREANAFLERGTNAFFSFGKPLLQGKKSATACMHELPIERLLLETDAPWQTLKDEKFTPATDIMKVYEKAAEIRSVSENTCVKIEDIAETMKKNFKSLNF